MEQQVIQHLKEYALYKGDKFVDLGTIRKLSVALGIKEASLRYLLYPAYQRRIARRNTKNPMILIEIEEDDDEPRTNPTTRS